MCVCPPSYSRTAGLAAHEVLEVGAMLEVLAHDVPAVARRVQRLLMPSLWPGASQAQPRYAPRFSLAVPHIALPLA